MKATAKKKVKTAEFAQYPKNMGAINYPISQVSGPPLPWGFARWVLPASFRVVSWTLYLRL